MALLLTLNLLMAAAPFLFVLPLRRWQLARRSHAGLPVPRVLVPHLFGFTLPLGRILGAMHANLGYAQAVVDLLCIRSDKGQTVVFLSSQLSSLAPLVFALGLVADAPAPLVSLHSDGKTVAFTFTGAALHTYLESELGCRVRTGVWWLADLEGRLRRQTHWMLGYLWRVHVQGLGPRERRS